MRALLKAFQFGFTVSLSAVILLFGATEIFASKGETETVQKTAKLEK